MKEHKFKIIRLATGALIFAVGIITSGYLEIPLFIASYIILGYDVLFQAVKNILKSGNRLSGKVFDENFLMSIATLGAIIIGEYPEAAAVMLFWQTGEFFQEIAVTRSRKSITELMDIRPDYANLLLNNEISVINPSDVKIGDSIIIRAGEKIPLDGVVVAGESSVNTVALTGESAPRYAGVGDEVISGCVNITGVLTVKVTKSFGESTAAKILELTQNAASKKARTENFITSFSRIYTPVVVIAALLIGIIPSLFGGQWSEWLRRALVFLVISCPCALVVSVPLGFFAGIGAASKKGVLVKGGNYLEALAELDIAAFDKTGTLTKGNFKVTEIIPHGDFTETELLKAAAQAESLSKHPIAAAVREAWRRLMPSGGEIEPSQVSDYKEKAGRGVTAVVNQNSLLVGSAEFLKESGVDFEEIDRAGTKLYVVIDKKYTGCIIVSDQIREDSRFAVLGLRKAGVRKIVILTGDNLYAADVVAREVGADYVKAGLLPQEKVAAVEALESEKRPKGKIAFIGDGINDAPVLARADLGVAMGGFGSDAAIEAADVVLMTDSPSKLTEAVSIAKRTRRIVKGNIIFALTAKVGFLILGALGIATMREAVFADVGVSLLAILNTLRILKVR